MDLEQHPLYQEFVSALLDSHKKNSNLLIITVPGIGTSHFIKKFVEGDTSGKFQHVKDGLAELKEFNILDLNFEKNPESFNIATRYFKKAKLSQKIAIVVNTPAFLKTDTYLKSTVASHIYNTYYFKTLGQDIIKVIENLTNIILSPEQEEKVYFLSGGLSHLTKSLIVNSGFLNKPASELLDEPDIFTPILLTIRVISQCNIDILNKLEITQNGIFKSEILKKYFSLHPINLPPQIVINKDLSFTEDGIPSEYKLIKIEKQIIEMASKEDGLILKEKIADLKWGGGSYDDFSDQAIGKTMQRLGKKLIKHQLLILPKVGYKIVKI